MLDGVTNREKQIQAFPGGQLVVVTITRDRNPLDQFHHEVGTSRLGRPGIENLGDIGVIHHGQRLPLRFEAGDHLPGVHAQFDDLQGHPAFDGLLLLRHVNHPKATLAHFLQQLVAVDHRARSFRQVGSVNERRGLIRTRERRRGAATLRDSRGVHEGIGFEMIGKQALHSLAQAWIVATGAVEESRPCLGMRMVQRREKNLFFPARRRAVRILHRAYPTTSGAVSRRSSPSETKKLSVPPRNQPHPTCSSGQECQSLDPERTRFSRFFRPDPADFTPQRLFQPSPAIGPMSVHRPR